MGNVAATPAGKVAIAAMAVIPAAYFIYISLDRSQPNDSLEFNNIVGTTVPDKDDDSADGDRISNEEFNAIMGDRYNIDPSRVDEMIDMWEETDEEDSDEEDTPAQ